MSMEIMPVPGVIRHHHCGLWAQLAGHEKRQVEDAKLDSSDLLPTYAKVLLCCSGETSLPGEPRYQAYGI
jgi:hypothetical protein